MEKVKLEDRVKIIGTGESVFMTKGTAYEVHPIRAKKLVDEKKAVYAGNSKLDSK